MANIVFVGTSLDGYIADREGGLDFLQTVPNPDGIDFGFSQFMEGVDAVIMGRKTYETVMGFGGAWPYSKPVFVLSSTLVSVPAGVKGKVEIVNGPLREVVTRLNEKGVARLYIDGGNLIQGFLAEDMIDELIVTQVPILLGGGVSLYGRLPNHLEFELVKTEVLLETMIQSHYRRKKIRGKVQSI